MKRHHFSTAAAVCFAVVMLSSGCGSSSSKSAAATATNTSPSAAASSAASSDASSAASTGDASSANASASASSGAKSGSTSAPAGGSSASNASGGKACYHPAGVDHFFKLDSAEVDQGDTRLNITKVTCTVNPANDEDVSYTPIGASTSVLVHADAKVQVLSGGSALKTVPAGWLVDNKLTNSPYFYYQANTQNQITSMQEVYHP